MDNTKVYRLGLATFARIISDKIRKPPSIESVFGHEETENKVLEVEKVEKVEKVVQAQPVSTCKSETATPLQPKIPILINKSLSLPEQVKQVKLDMPTTQETVEELKQRLGKELYRIELDLQSGARIAGKSCDCLSESKHTGAVKAVAEELMSYEKNPVYGKIVDWFNNHASKFQPSAIAKTEPDYYRSLTPEVRELRKEVMGTEKVGAIFNQEEKEMIRKRAAEKMRGELE